MKQNLVLRKSGPIVGGNRKLWFSFFTDFDALLELNVNDTIFYWKSSLKYKNWGVNHHQAIFSWFSIFLFVIFQIFGPGRHHFWPMTSYWRHNDVTWDFFPSIAPSKVVLRLCHRIVLHIDQSSFSGLWVNLPPPQPSNDHRIAQPQ